MGTTIKLSADDGHQLDAYRADPDDTPRGGIVVIQEIFGVNSHIRDLCDRFAGDGYTALAPALFDRAEPGIELGYTPDDVTAGREWRAKVDWDGAMADIAAAVAVLREDGTVGCVGYCWGGSLAWLSACRLEVDCAVGYYGGQIIQFYDEQPQCPVILHFGETDASIPMDDVETIRDAHDDVPVHVYPAGHGFNCDQRGSYDAASAADALPRTMALFAEHIG